MERAFFAPESAGEYVREIGEKSGERAEKGRFVDVRRWRGTLPGFVERSTQREQKKTGFYLGASVFYGPV